jgi:hypothetical protein
MVPLTAAPTAAAVRSPTDSGSAYATASTTGTLCDAVTVCAVGRVGPGTAVEVTGDVGATVVVVAGANVVVAGVRTATQLPMSAVAVPTVQPATAPHCE